MKLEQTNTGFREIIKAWRVYEALELSPDSIPAGAKLVIEHLGEDGTRVTICKDHPFNATVKAARASQIAVSNLKERVSPYIKYNVDNWTPEKLAEIQAKNKEQNSRYRELLSEYKECTRVYNDALDAQRVSIATHLG